jgi:hypothetical protein
VCVRVCVRTWHDNMMIIDMQVVLFPTRAFAIGSGGAGLDGHSSLDQLVRHNFKGTWKRGYVDFDHLSSSSSSRSSSYSSYSSDRAAASSLQLRHRLVGRLHAQPASPRLWLRTRPGPWHPELMDGR